MKVKKRKRRKPKKQRYKVCAFEQTPIGYLIKHECPIEWGFLTDIKQTRGLTITPELIENITYMSDNYVFRTERFRKALMDFREYGYATPNKKEFDLEDELRYIKDRLRGIKRLEQ